MSDSFETHASTLHGSMHTGTGDIYHQIVLPPSKLLGPLSRRHHANELRWLCRRFVAPAGLGRARDILETARTVFLDGRPGSGRTAAAQMLLWELGDDQRQLHELVLQEDERALRIDPSHIVDDDLVWLDLSSITGGQWGEVHAELPPLCVKVRDHDAYLVVVLPDDSVYLGSALDPYRIEIRCPAVDEVLHRYLLADDIPHPVPLPQLEFLNADRRMDEVARYAGLIRRARDERREADFAAWCKEAFHALFRQVQEVAEQVTGATAPQRALLLAVAMLHEAHADVIHEADAALLTVVKHPSEDSPLLERVPFDQRLKEIEAEVDSSGHVQFTKLDYDVALRSYFWAHMPELRSALKDWVKQTIDSPALSPAERTKLVERLTEQCSNERYRSTLVSLVERWTERSATTRQVEAAAVVVQRGLRDEHLARSFRRQIYDWARTDGLPQRLAEVIIVACRDEMMARHPDEAMVRLHHVARREHGTRAGATLIELVGGAPRLRRQMLTRLTDPKFSPGRWERDVDLFLRLADPEALTAPGRRDQAPITAREVRRQLTAGWSLVFARRPHDVWASTTRWWLQVAAADEQHRHTLLDVLVTGGKEDAGVLARLYATAREREAWAPLGDLIIQEINAVRAARAACSTNGEAP